MNTETMNIRAGLKERKLLDERIEKTVRELTLAKAYCKDDPMIGLLTPEEYEQKIKSDFQSLQDMISRREAINKGLLEINAATKIKVPKFVSFQNMNDGEEEEISLATAIARKTYYKETLSKTVKSLSNSLVMNMREIEEVKQRANEKIREAISSRFNNQTNFSQSVFDEHVKQQQAKFEVVLINPLDITNTLTTVNTAIEDYIQNIDNKLSAATETTEFTITY